MFVHKEMLLLRIRDVQWRKMGLRQGGRLNNALFTLSSINIDGQIEFSAVQLTAMGNNNSC